MKSWECDLAGVGRMLGESWARVKERRFVFQYIGFNLCAVIRVYEE
jgi:hypothetical protein